MSCGDKNKTVYHKISECSKLAQKTRHDWVGNLLHRELCKRLKSDHTTKWYMLKPESIHRILYYFEIEMDHLIQARRPNLRVNKKRRICLPVDFVVPAEHRGKTKESEKINSWILQEN